MPGVSESLQLQLLHFVADVFDGGLLAIGPDDQLLAASGDEIRALGIEPAATGGSVRTASVDYRVMLLVDAARRTGGVETRELTAAGDLDLVLRARRSGADPTVFISVRDQTRVRHLERVRRDFVSNVSHELRTPVAAIRLMAETLESGALDDREAAEDFVRRIRLEATQMTQMLEELLELSSIESGLRPLRHDRVGVASLLTAAERLRPLAEAKEVRITFNVGPGVPDLWGDGPRLGQAVRNLVHNGIKFTNAGGHVAITATPEGTALVRISVSDDGVGIAPADLPRIFERFWKADSSRQRDGEGTGLGLAIVRHVVEGHGGSVSVESEPRRGTTFTLLLPAAPAA